MRSTSSLPYPFSSLHTWTSREDRLLLNRTDHSQCEECCKTRQSQPTREMCMPLTNRSPDRRRAVVERGLGDWLRHAGDCSRSGETEQTSKKLKRPRAGCGEDTPGRHWTRGDLRWARRRSGVGWMTSWTSPAVLRPIPISACFPAANPCPASSRRPWPVPTERVPRRVACHVLLEYSPSCLLRP